MGNLPSGQTGSGGVSQAFATGPANSPPSYDMLLASEFAVYPNVVIDQSANLQSFLNALALGGTGFIAPGDYYLSQEVFLNISSGVSRNIVLLGAGATLHPLGSPTGLFCIRGANTPFNQLIVGLEAWCVDGGGNLKSGFRQEHTANVNWECCTVYANANVNANFGGWYLNQSDPNDNNTGCFWNRFPGCSVRSVSGIVVPNGVVLDGSMNATDFGGMYITGCVNSILMKTATGSTTPAANLGTANSVRACGMWIEGATNAVVNQAAGAASYGPYGLRIDDNRFEGVNTVLSLLTATNNHQSIPCIGKNNVYLQDVVQLVNNPNNLLVDVEQATYGGSLQTPLWLTQFGQRFSTTTVGFNYIIELALENLGKALNFTRSGLQRGYISVETIGGQERFIVNGNIGGFIGLNLLGVQSISMGNTPANNLAGHIFLNGAGTGTVTFPSPEPNADYSPFVSLSEVAVPGPVDVSNRTANGFDVKGPANATVWWFIIRNN